MIYQEALCLFLQCTLKPSLSYLHPLFNMGKKTAEGGNGSTLKIWIFSLWFHQPALSLSIKTVFWWIMNFWKKTSTLEVEVERMLWLQLTLKYLFIAKSVLGIHWKDWCWSWNSNTLATWCGELTHLKRPWWWERLRAEGEGIDRGWNG